MLHSGIILRIIKKIYPLTRYYLFTEINAFGYVYIVYASIIMRSVILCCITAYTAEDIAIT